jgi:hypothetical protein
MKVNINVPDSLNEITLYQYQRFEKLIQENEASHFVNQKTIEIFCNIELKDVARIRIADIDDLLSHLNNLLQQKPKLTKTFKLGVYEFGFIPKLEDMTSGEFIDLENYLGSTETLHQAMAVLFRPIKSKVKDLYIIEEYESSYKYSEVLKYMPSEAGFGKKYGWYQSIYAASQGNILNFDAVTKLPITKLMMWLMFEKEKTEIEIKNIKRNGI